MDKKKVLRSNYLNTLKVVNDLNKLNLVIEMKGNKSQNINKSYNPQEEGIA